MLFNFDISENRLPTSLISNRTDHWQIYIAVINHQAIDELYMCTLNCAPEC